MEFIIEFELIVFSIERMDDKDEEVLVIICGGGETGVNEGIAFLLLMASANRIEICAGGRSEFDGLRKRAEIIVRE